MLFTSVFNISTPDGSKCCGQVLTGARKREHITPILKTSNWLPVHYRIDLKILVFVFESLNDLALSDLSDLNNISQQDVCYSLSQPRSRGDRAFVIIPSFIWESFKFGLKHILHLIFLPWLFKLHMLNCLLIVLMLFFSGLDFICTALWSTAVVFICA